MSDPVTRLNTALEGRYAIERELGEGGMATVYLAEDLKLHRQVAIKVLRPELAASLGADRFLQEIELTAKLQHPQILPLHEAGEADGFLYYVMPYIEGESLRDRLKREGTLSVEDAIKITDDIGAALSYADGRGVVHRDIKPENVLLTGGRAVVADFGIARAVTAAGGERLTGTGLAIGTPAYMSPEQWMGQEDVDGRSDVYALGCVVYEMVAGRPPFEGTTPQALLAKHMVDTVPGLRASDPAIPVFVERAVERALAKSPADRFQSASAFAEALTSGTVVARVGRRRWRSVVGAATAVVLLLAAGGWWLATLAGGPAIERLAVLPLANLTNDPGQELFVQGVHEALISELGQAGATVIARRSVMQYENTPVRQIATELEVDAVIDGSVFRMGDSVRIDVRLVDGRTEAQLWSGSYADDVRNVLNLYSELTRAIADEIQLPLTQEADARLARARPVIPEAYEAYVRGQVYWDRLTPQDIETALQYFERATQIDPDYAPAYAGIAQVWGARQQQGVVPASEATPLARAAAEKAIELDSTLAEAQLVVAGLKTWSDWDWEGAETAFRRAIALNPSYGKARAYYSLFLTLMNRPDEAFAQIERALELDPYNFLFQAFLGMDLMYVDRFDEAIAQFRTTLETTNFPLARNWLSQALQKQGMYDEALAEATAYAAALGDRELEQALAQGYADGGYPEAMRRAAETLAARSRTTYVGPLWVAGLYARAGENDHAFQWMERAYDMRDPNMPHLAVNPGFDSLHDDPRFPDLLRRMNLSQ